MHLSLLSHLHPLQWWSVCKAMVVTSPAANTPFIDVAPWALPNFHRVVTAQLSNPSTIRCLASGPIWTKDAHKVRSVLKPVGVTVFAPDRLYLHGCHLDTCGLRHLDDFGVWCCVHFVDIACPFGLQVCPAIQVRFTCSTYPLNQSPLRYLSYHHR